MKDKCSWNSSENSRHFTRVISSGTKIAVKKLLLKMLETSAVKSVNGAFVQNKYFESEFVLSL